MIKLNGASITKVQTLQGGVVVSEVLTDTLFINEVRLDFAAGTLHANIKRGSGTPFAENLQQIAIDVSVDGNFQSSDGAWVGTIPNMGAFFAQLAGAFDQFVLASGLIDGQGA